jgi:outer membrane immunogenic protein
MIAPFADFGGNVGVSWGRAITDFNAAPVTVVTFPPLTTSHIDGFAGSQQVDPAGIIGGGQIGYNWQFSPTWVLGIEADIQASGEKDSTNFTDPFSFTIGIFPSFPVTGAAVTNYEAEIKWFGTVRGRIGYVWDRLMLYATGGLAYGRVEVAGTSTVSGTAGGSPFSVTHAIGHSQNNTGWTVGVGLEGALGNNWTLKAEYLYVDLGSLNDTDDEVICEDPPGLTICSVGGGQVLTHTHFTDGIFRVGLNYQFR